MSRAASVLTLGFLLLGVEILQGCGDTSTGKVVTPPTNNQPPPSGGGTGGGGTSSDTAQGAVLLIRSTPSQSNTIMSFSVTVTGAMLEPGDVPLLSAMVPVELNRLQVEAGLLSSVQIPAGNYTSLTLTFADPSLTILNPTTSAIGSCAAGAICAIPTTLSTSTISLNSAPFPMTVTDSAQPILVLDFDLSQSLSNISSVNPVLTLRQVGLTDDAGGVMPVKQAVGAITYTGGDDLVDGAILSLKTSMGTLVRIDDDSATYIDTKLCGLDFCVAGELAEADLTLNTEKTFPSAQRFVLKDPTTAQVDGIVTAINGEQFDMLVTYQTPAATGVVVGQSLHISPQSNASFEFVDDGNSSSRMRPGIFSLFASAADLMVGQVVNVHAAAAASGSPLTLTTDRVRLKSGAFTARVKSISSETLLVIDSLPANFPVSELQAQLTDSHFGEGITGANNALKPGDTVSLSGFLFGITPKSPKPTLLVEGLRKR